MKDEDLSQQKFDAQIRRADAQLDVLQAQARARKARAEMDEISGLREARDRARARLADIKQRTAEEIEAAKRTIASEINELEVAIARVRDRYAEWDDVRERRFNARLDQADAKLRLWKASVAKAVADIEIAEHDVLAKLSERAALARARLADWQRDRRDRKARQALENAAQNFDAAYDEAAKLYEP